MSAAEKFVTDRNRRLRVETAEKESVEHQITVNEVWAVDQEALINDRRTELIDQGKLTDAGIHEDIEKMIESFEKEAQSRIDERINKHLDSFTVDFTLPEQPSHVTEMLINRFISMTGDERMEWMKDALTGKNKEVALALLHGPQTLTGINDDTRDTLTANFMSEADIVKAERNRDIKYRAQAAVETLETIRRRLRS